MKFAIPKLYTELATYYDSLESQYRNYDLELKWLETVLDQKHARRVVDISCGSANHIAGIAKQSTISELLAMDASKEMLSVARSKLVKTRVDILQSDFLNPPFRQGSFDAAICMYWSIAGLDENLTRDLFSSVNSLLRKGGLLVLDTENTDGIKEYLIGVPFIDAYFQKNNVAVLRANFSIRVEDDLVDWHSYYLIEKGSVSEIIEDRMMLRFYSKDQIERLLRETGFETKEVRSGDLKEYSMSSPTLYFVAEKK